MYSCEVLIATFRFEDQEDYKDEMTQQFFTYSQIIDIPGKSNFTFFSPKKVIMVVFIEGG